MEEFFSKTTILIKKEPTREEEINKPRKDKMTSGQIGPMLGT